MRSSLRLLNKICQLDLQQRCDITALLHIFGHPPRPGRRTARRLPSFFPKEYVQGWAAATGAEPRQMRQFLAGSTDRSAFPKCVLVNLSRSSRHSVFMALWTGDTGWEEPVLAPVCDTFYVLQGGVQLTVERQAQCSLSVRLGPHSDHQVDAGASYQLHAAAGSQVIVVQSRLETLH